MPVDRRRKVPAYAATPCTARATPTRGLKALASRRLGRICMLPLPPGLPRWIDALFAMANAGTSTTSQRGGPAAIADRFCWHGCVQRLHAGTSAQPRLVTCVVRVSIPSAGGRWFLRLSPGSVRPSFLSLGPIAAGTSRPTCSDLLGHAGALPALHRPFSLLRGPWLAAVVVLARLRP